MAGIRRKPTNGGFCQAWFIDYTGTRQFFTMRGQKQALRKAQALEDEHTEIRKGLRPVPRSADRHAERRFLDMVEEYLAWGESQGGRNGKPWGKTHARNRQSQLDWWQERLGLVTLADLDGILPRVEEALRELQAQGRAGKTMANYAESLGAFCDWCVKRGYLDNDPLAALVPFDTTPQIRRRAMTVDVSVRTACQRATQSRGGSSRGRARRAAPGRRLD